MNEVRLLRSKNLVNFLLKPIKLLKIIEKVFITMISDNMRQKLYKLITAIENIPPLKTALPPKDKR